MAELEADVVIVGSGVAGTLLADRLRSTGARLLILEAGPRSDRQEAVKTYRDSPVRLPESAWPAAPWAPRPSVGSLQDYYVQMGPDLFKSTYERRAGGTTWHWLGTAMRRRPDDFEPRTRYGVAQDWPLTYEDLEPWYVQAEHELGVSGDSAVDDGSPRSAPFPMPAIHPSYLDLAVARALKPMGIAVVPTPQARNSRPWQNRMMCCGSSSCIPVCPVGAKYDAASVHLARCEKAGVRVEVEAVVHHVEIGADGRVSEVLFKRPDGSEHRAVGRCYVLAAHAIETPKILLASRTPALPEGVANSSGQVGRNLMDHPIMLSWALAGEPLYPFRGPLSTSGITHFRDGDFRRTRAAFRVEIGNDGWRWPVGDLSALVPEMVARGIRGTALREALKEHGQRQIRLASLCEQLPDPENRVVPAFDRLDPLGIPRPRLHYRVDDYTRRGMKSAEEFHERLFRALKSTETHHDPAFQGAGHVMGTCRMGRDPRSSVLDSHGRSHDHPNLFVVGSAVFPSAGTANPTLTLAALSLRTADRVKADLEAR